MATDIEPSPAFAPQIGRVYLRVSTDAQDLRRQDAIVAEAKAAGYYVAAVYREKASGARADRPELLRMIADLQPGEVVIAEKIDRISRLPLAEAEQLVETIRARGARLAIPGVVDLSDLAADAEGIARIVLESVQAMLLKIARLGKGRRAQRRAQRRSGNARPHCGIARSGQEHCQNGRAGRLRPQHRQAGMGGPSCRPGARTQPSAKSS